MHQPFGVKQIICLSSSRKLSGRCIAGKEAWTGEWIRPVGLSDTEELSAHERQYENGTEPDVLDIIDIPIKHACPRLHQSENWLIEPGYYWSSSGLADWEDLTRLQDYPRTLWINGHSTSEGVNNYVKLSEAKTLPGSLYLIRPDQMTLRVCGPNTFQRSMLQRVQADFYYNGDNYRIWVTDPVVESNYISYPIGDYPVEECYLTVSLGEPFKMSRCYKLVAAVITPT